MILKSPSKCNFWVGFVVPIPTNPPKVVVITVPPVPTVILSPTANNPLSNVNLVSVSKSPLFLNNTELLSPGGATVIVTATPGCGNSTPSAVIALPSKFNCVVLLRPPTSWFSSNTLREPGIIPPWFGIQNLSPGLSIKLTTIYCCPAGKFGVPWAVGVSPRFGSASPGNKYLYLSAVNADWGVFL